MVAGLYYGLPADHSTQLWKEFQKGLELTNAVNGISCARYWSLILQHFYNKEGILVPNDEEKVTFQSYHFPKEVVDDADDFRNVARIPDAMLKRVNPTNSILIAYHKTFDPSIPMGMLLPREETKSKQSKKSKKANPTSPAKKSKGSTSSKSPQKVVEENVVVTVEPTYVSEPIVEETQEKGVIPSKTGMFRRIKIKSTHKRMSPAQKLIQKHQVSHQGVLIRDIPVPVSPSSKKRATEDMAKHLAKGKKMRKTRKIVLSTESTKEDERIPETPEFNSLISSTPEQTIIIPPKVSIAKSILEEVRTSDITAHVSDTDANVNMGEGGSKDANQGPFISTPFKSLVSVTPTSTIPISSTTISPTFKYILNQPITSMLSSQSTDTPRPSSPTETDHEGFGGTFEDLEFHDEEEDFPDHMLITMKRYKILNQNLNSIIQSQADMGGGSSLSSLEIDSMLKLCESRIISKVSGMLKASELVLMEKIDFTDQTNELRIKNPRSNFLGEVKDLRNVTKE